MYAIGTGSVTQNLKITVEDFEHELQEICPLLNTGQPTAWRIQSDIQGNVFQANLGVFENNLLIGFSGNPPFDPHLIVFTPGINFYPPNTFSIGGPYTYPYADWSAHQVMVLTDEWIYATNTIALYVVASQAFPNRLALIAASATTTRIIADDFGPGIGPNP